MDSYGTCLVIAPHPEQLFDAFADGLRRRYGRPPLAGFPRITQPLLELSVRRGDATGAREALARIDALDLCDADRRAAAAGLTSVAELRAASEDLDADRGHP